MMSDNPSLLSLIKDLLQFLNEQEPHPSERRSIDRGDMASYMLGIEMGMLLCQRNPERAQQLLDSLQGKHSTDSGAEGIQFIENALARAARLDM